MRNLVIVILLLLFFSFSNSFAQIAIGVKAGLNVNDRFFEIDQVYNVTLNPAPQRTKLGYHIGLNLSYELNNSFAVNSGLLYVNKGSSIDVQDLYERPMSSWDNSTRKVDGYSRSNYNYLEIPLQLTYKIWKGLKISGGAYAAVGIYGRQNDDYVVYQNGNKDFEKHNNEKLIPAFGQSTIGTIQNSEGGPLIINDKFNRFNGFDYGLNLGLGYQFDKLLFSSEYSLGLGNVTPNYTNFGSDIHRHRILYFSVSYLLFEK